MIPGNVDPRRPDKVQRYKPAASTNGSAPGEDLTPDYMNILGPDSTTGNAHGDSKQNNEIVKNSEGKPASLQQSQNAVAALNSASIPKSEVPATNAIPTSSQYDVTNIPTNTNDIPNEVSTPATDTITESTAKTSSETDAKPENVHSTPSKTDRFKVVKIASSEPFRRGRWKCMDFVDQVPVVTSQLTKTSTQNTPSSVQMGGNVYLQTQSLPPHQIQQLLLQGALAAAAANPPQYYQTNNMQNQVLPPQYFYPAVQQNQANMAQQLINPGVVPTSTSIQPQFMNQTQQQYFQPAVLPQNYQAVQFIQQAYQNQNSAFVPTTQNFQQAQTYAGQPAVTQQSQTQSIPATQPQPMVNGFAYSPQNISDQQIAANSIPTQVAKNVVLNSNPVQVVQNQTGMPMQNQQQQESQNSVSTVQQIPEQASAYQQQQIPNQILQNINPLQNVVVLQTYDPSQTTDAYSNPQFVASVHNLPIIDQKEGMQITDCQIEIAQDLTVGGNPEDPGKTNPVVNAIDNKIEQAMDLVKSHLMYTVREEVEVLKEKIAELMERIQQLESENNFLRSQLPKNNPNSNGTEPSHQPQ